DRFGLDEATESESCMHAPRLANGSTDSVASLCPNRLPRRLGFQVTCARQPPERVCYGEKSGRLDTNRRGATRGDGEFPELASPNLRATPEAVRRGQFDWVPAATGRSPVAGEKRRPRQGFPKPGYSCRTNPAESACPSLDRRTRRHHADAGF